MRNKKTSTAALGSVHQGFCSGLRGVPGHLSGARSGRWGRSKDCGGVAIEERFLAAHGMTEFSESMSKEDAMSARTAKDAARDVRTMLPVILRVACSLVLWTLGAMPMKLPAEPPKEDRVVYTFAVDRAQTENLQRSVNAGHDAWCRDPQLVAVASMRRISGQFDEEEAASLPLELERREKTEAVYTFHSSDGLKTYRITLRRYEWLLPAADSMHRMIWVPEKVEIVTRKILD